MSILYSLFKHANTLEMLIRLLNKFLELDKIDRLVEMHVQYHQRLLKANQEEYMDRLESGLFTLQLVDWVLLECIHLEHPLTSIKDHAEILLKREGLTLDAVRGIVEEFAETMEDGTEEKDKTEKILK
jgi:beta-catenin-like protein 1